MAFREERAAQDSSSVYVVVVRLWWTSLEGEREVESILNGQEEVWERGVGLVRRGGGDEVEGVGGAPDSNVFDLSRKMYFTKRTVDRAKVTIC